MMVHRRKIWLYQALVVQMMFQWEYPAIFSFWMSKDGSLDKQGSSLATSVSQGSILIG